MPKQYDLESEETNQHSYRPEGMYQDEESCSDGLISDRIAEDAEDEYYAVKYAKDYTKKMEDDMNTFHTKNTSLRKEMQEIHELYDKEVNDLSEWKQNAIVKFKNYKIAIKELMHQIDQVREEKEKVCLSLKEEVENSKQKNKDIMQDYHEEQLAWASDHEDQMHQAKQKYQQKIEEKEIQMENKITSYELQIEDMTREINSLNSERATLLNKWKWEIEEIKRLDAEYSVKEWVNNMLDILEMKDKHRVQMDEIKKLQTENEKLKKSKTTKSLISMKNIRGGSKLNISGVTLSSQVSNGKFKGIKAFKRGNGQPKLKISKNKIKGINNFSVIEKKPASVIRDQETANINSALNKLKHEKDKKVREREALKSKLKEYYDHFSRENGHGPSSSDPTYLKIVNAIKTLKNQIDFKDREIRNYEETSLKQLKCRSVSPGTSMFSVMKRSSVKESADTSYGREVDISMQKKEISPYRQEDTSFFSNENEISHINFTTNKSNLQFDNSLDVDMNEMKMDRLHKFKMENEKKKETSISENESHCSSSQPINKTKEGLSNTEREIFKQEVESKILAQLEQKHKKEVELLVKSHESKNRKHTLESSNFRRDLWVKKSELEQLSKKYRTDVEHEISVNEKLRSDLYKIDENNKKLKHKLQGKVDQIQELTQKYIQAEGEKRDMHNQMVDMQGRIRVYCRVRPLSQKEVLRNETEALKVVDDYTVEVNAGDAPSKVESYDAVFGPNSTQNQVFDNVKRLVKSAVDGYNVCIFAYGSTGSGKTHTIQGTQSDPGICPKALTELFQIIDVANEKGDCEFTVQ